MDKLIHAFLHPFDSRFIGFMHNMERMWFHSLALLSSPRRSLPKAQRSQVFLRLKTRSPVLVCRGAFWGGVRAHAKVLLALTSIEVVLGAVQILRNYRQTAFLRAGDPTRRIALHAERGYGDFPFGRWVLRYRFFRAWHELGRLVRALLTIPTSLFAHISPAPSFPSSFALLPLSRLYILNCIWHLKHGLL